MRFSTCSIDTGIGAFVVNTFGIAAAWRVMCRITNLNSVVRVILRFQGHHSGKDDSPLARLLLATVTVVNYEYNLYQ